VRRLLLLVLLAVIAAGCSDTVPGGKKVVSPTPDTVVGTLPKPAAAPKGDATAGKAVFSSSGCSACHTFKPAAATGKVGPDLDNLAAEAKQANQGTLEAFTLASITTPDAYIAPGFKAGIMPGTFGQSLSAQQLADLVAFLTQGS
jgi:mono/diheme cytochrome c family protein